MDIGQLFRLDNKTAFITGASSGIGKHCAMLLSQAGAKVAIADRDLAKGEALAAGRAAGLAARVATRDAVNAGTGTAEQIAAVKREAEGLGERPPVALALPPPGPPLALPHTLTLLLPVATLLRVLLTAWAQACVFGVSNSRQTDRVRRHLR